ncbi:uncharacterized protein EI97DRAFT_451543 [Westerdykella ornata]|uniref:Uncharacterized protein n=1 Tax=Westerdykella ornata TaxID=318751 RepID=A0A6A6JDR1_WESOR|nr:uncharacterized protein EI97DRAFT_451543 [Westerdykella ornata]KAF2274750.1 hypothetical protein EI97DRAFT_451543 [Westerdykella ornata]
MSTNLMSLPPEVRLLIYEQLFGSYVIRHGHGRHATRSNQNRAALLLTCSKIHNEAWPILPQRAMLHFHGTEAMIETLMGMDLEHITRIRHIRVTPLPFPLYGAGCTEFRHMYYFDDAIKLIGRLNLDQLIIDDAFHGFADVEGWSDVVTYFNIEALPKSDGWSELIYITPNTDFMTSCNDHRQERKAQSQNWRQMLLERDGESSGAGVSMYITPEKEDKGDANGNSEAMRPYEAERKGVVRVVARRGRRQAIPQLGGELDALLQRHTDAFGWIYGGLSRRVALAQRAFNY